MFIMKRDFQSELEKIDKVIDQLSSIAASDGKITKEEQNLLDNIMNELSDYRLLVMDALDDGTIDAQEEKDMGQALDRIVEHASNIALADGTLSKDEETLIEQLISFADDF